jgi:hypothetical protein
MDDARDPAQPFDGCWEAYERAKAAYLALHPEASAQEIEQAMQDIAQELGL